MARLKGFLSLLFLATSANAQVYSTEEALAEQILKTIQESKFNNVDKFLLTEKDYSSEYLPLMANDTIHKIPPVIFDEGASFYKLKKNIILFQKVLSDIRIKGTELGIADWKDVQLEKVKLKPYSTSTANTAVIESGEIFLKYRDKRFALIAVMVVKLSYGYKLMMIQGIQQIHEKTSG